MSVRHRPKHAAAVEEARANPGQWVRAAVYGSSASADSAARRVPGAVKFPAYEPAGSFEAYAVLCEDGPVMWVRSVEGGPYPPLPGRMSVRIPAAVGPELGEVGVLTVAVVPCCQTCGGPRGWDRVQPVEITLNGTTVMVDRWANPCGHDDVYADLLEEARRTPPLVDPAVRAASRGMGHHPGEPRRAGEFREAVELILQHAAERQGMHAKAAAQILLGRGHEEAARLIDLQIRANNGHMSAKQAAHFLTVEGARRASASNTRQEANA